MAAKQTLDSRKRKIAGKKEKTKMKAAAAVKTPVFPMACLNRIVKEENSDSRMTSESLFLINKASEKFIELLSQEAYACASEDRNKKIEYKHLASLIPKDKRYEFLTDILPVKVRAADAMKEVPTV